jgi:hypothetical protein
MITCTHIWAACCAVARPSSAIERDEEQGEGSVSCRRGPKAARPFGGSLCSGRAGISADRCEGFLPCYSLDDINLAPAGPVLAGVFIYLSWLHFGAGVSSLRQRGALAHPRRTLQLSSPAGWSWPRPDPKLAGAARACAVEINPCGSAVCARDLASRATCLCKPIDRDVVISLLLKRPLRPSLHVRAPARARRNH